MSNSWLIQSFIRLFMQVIFKALELYKVFFLHCIMQCQSLFLYGFLFKVCFTCLFVLQSHQLSFGQYIVCILQHIFFHCLFLSFFCSFTLGVCFVSSICWIFLNFIQITSFCYQLKLICSNLFYLITMHCYSNRYFWLSCFASPRSPCFVPSVD